MHSLDYFSVFMRLLIPRNDQSPDGDVIDCVHISKQPAFDHPFLKNHTILVRTPLQHYTHACIIFVTPSFTMFTFQMRPSYHPGDLHGDSNIARRLITQTWHQNGKCPENTIPIRRTKEEDILWASAVRSHGKKMTRSIQNLVSVNDLARNISIGHQVQSSSSSKNHLHVRPISMEVS